MAKLRVYEDLDYKKRVDALKKKVPALASVLTKAFIQSKVKDLRSYAFFVTNLEKISQVLFIKRSLEDALQNGESLKTWREGIRANTEFKDAYDNLSNSRLETVFRTNIGQAQRDGILEKAGRFGRMVEFVAVLDSRTRPSHAELDSVIRPASDPFWLTHSPLLGYNCRCTLITHDPDLVKITDKRTVEKRKKAYRKKGGNTLFSRNSTSSTKELKSYQKKRAEKAGIKTEVLRQSEKRHQRSVDRLINKIAKDFDD